MAKMRNLINLIEGRSALYQSHNPSYQREIPRDLFNEANLLKCYGKLYLELERLAFPAVELVHNGADPFVVAQDMGSGNLTISNVHLMVRGRPCPLSRPLNSRDAWPLYATTDEDEIDVFDSNGNLTNEMRAFLRGQE